MIFRKVSLLTTLFLIAVLGCEYTKPVLHPVDTIVPLSPEMSQTLMQNWWSVTTIDGELITESLSELQTLIAEHVSDEMSISFFDTGIASSFWFNADGTWGCIVTYNLFADFSSVRKNSLIYIHLFVVGNYVAGYDSEKQTNVLIFETDKHTAVGIYHENPDSDPPLPCIPEEPCYQPDISPVFTEDLDWRIFEDAPLSKLFSSPFLTPRPIHPWCIHGIWLLL